MSWNAKANPCLQGLGTETMDVSKESAAGRREKLRIREVLVVEGRYDRNALSQVVDALIFETGGFSILKNPEKLRALRMLAQERGLIILTDSDDAGFLIRSRLKGLLPPEKIRQAFIPRVEGKERRKQKPSRQGLLGVEGMPPEVLLRALRNAGVTEEAVNPGHEVSTADFYALGLTGKGLVAEGMDADLNVFDPACLREVGTFGDPARFPVGMDTVLVSGVPVLLDGALTGRTPGTVLTRVD